MPTIRNNSATSGDANNGRTFADIGPRGAVLNMWAAGDDALDSIALTVGDKQVLVASEVNLETGVNVIDTERDQILFNEVVPGGHIFVPIVATAAVGYQIAIRYL